jgi:D-lactate dehydrogenase
MPLNAQLSHSVRNRFYSEARYARGDGSVSPVRSVASIVEPPMAPTAKFSSTNSLRVGHYSPGRMGTPVKLTPIVKKDPHTMKIVLFSTKNYDKRAFEEEAARLNAAMGQPGPHHPVRIEMTFVESALGEDTMAQCPPGTDAVCGFVNDACSKPVLTFLAGLGVKLVLNRCAGFNNVDLLTARKCGMRVMRVPGYSSESIAEHAIALLQAVNRKTHIADSRCKEKNFDLQGLEGFALHGKTVAVIGAGAIGICAAKIYLGFGCRVFYFNRSHRKEHLELETLGNKLGPWKDDPSGRCVWLTMKEEASMDRLCEEADVISIHIPLVPATFHMLSKPQFDKMKRRPVIINVARGDIIDTEALVAALQSGKVGAAGLDVVEGEAGVFFGDHSGDEADAWQNGAKKTMAQLLEHERCMVTGHQAFLTHDALDQIASITLQNALDHLDDAHPERQRVLGAGGSSHGHVEFKQSDSGVVVGPLEEHSVTLSDAEAAKKEEEELSALRRAKWKKNISKVKNLAGLSRGLGNAFGK